MRSSSEVVNSRLPSRKPNLESVPTEPQSMSTCQRSCKTLAHTPRVKQAQTQELDKPPQKQTRQLSVGTGGLATSLIHPSIFSVCLGEKKCWFLGTEVDPHRRAQTPQVMWALHQQRVGRIEVIFETMQKLQGGALHCAKQGQVVIVEVGVLVVVPESLFRHTGLDKGLNKVMSDKPSLSVSVIESGTSC